MLGKRVDFIMLSEDPRAIAPNNLRNFEVDMTIVGGDLVYSRK